MNQKGDRLLLDTILQTPKVSWTITSCLVAIVTNYNEPKFFNLFSEFSKVKKNRFMSENIEAFRKCLMEI